MISAAQAMVFPRHLGLTLLAVTIGWVAQLAVYWWLATGGGSNHSRVIWMIWTGAFSLLGWLLVGIPLAIWRPSLRGFWRITVAVIATGIAGVLLVFLPLGGFRELVNAITTGQIFTPMGGAIPGLSFLAASVSMLCYAWLSRVPRKPGS